MRVAAALALLVWATGPASPHCYSVWKYPTPQHCGSGVMRQLGHNWYVEITAPPPPEKDERTPQDIEDQAEHDRAIKDKRQELIFQLELLKAKQATGLE